MTQRLLDYNPLSGMAVTFQYNEADDSITIGHHQDAEAVLEDNAWALQDLDAHKKAAKNEWAHYAKIPEIAILDIKARYGVDFFNANHFPKFMSILNSSEYKKLKRTTYNHDR